MSTKYLFFVAFLLTAFAAADRLVAQDSLSVPLTSILKTWEHDDDLHFLYESQTLKGIYLSAAEAAKLQPDTTLFQSWQKRWGLVVRPQKNGFFLLKPVSAKTFVEGWIKDERGTPLAGAYVFVEGSQRGTVTDLRGRFKLALPGGQTRIVVSYTGYGSIHESLFLAYGQQHRRNYNLSEDADLAEVIVVGTRFPPKPLLHGSSAADLVTSAALTQVPGGELGQSLQYLAPSFFSTYQTISDGSDHVDPATLRGLSPDQVLVLINGKRRHQSAQVHINNTIGRGSVGVDLNAIPQAAVKRVEILLDGAAAQYGTDAIAGVINFVLKDGDSPSTLSLSGGATTAGDGGQINLDGYHAWKLAHDGFVGLSLRWNHRDAINRSGAYTGPIYGDARDEDPSRRASFFSQTGYGGERVMEIGSAAVDNLGVFLNWASPKGKGFHAYGQVSGNYRLGRSVGFYRFPYQERRQSGLYPDGFSPEIQTDIYDFSIVNGLRGKHKEWMIDLSHNFGGNAMSYTVNNSNNASLGTASPTNARAGGIQYQQHVLNADISREYEGKRPLHLALGLQTRLETYTQRAGDEWSWQQYGDTTATGEPKEGGIQVFPGYRPTNAGQYHRLNAALYAQAEWEVNTKWSLEAGARWEYYPDYGLPASGKLASKYHLRKNLSFHTSIGLGYRAPSLPQLFFNNVSVQFVPQGAELVARRVAHLGTAQILPQRLRGAPLRSERARHLSTGLAWAPGKHWQLSLDAYQINLRDRLILSSRFATAELPPAYANFIETDLAQLFLNALNTRTQGVEVKTRYRITLPNSRLQLRTAISLNRTRLLDLSLPTDLSSQAMDIFTREDRNRLERGQPNSKLVLGMNWENDRWQLASHCVRFGAVRYHHPADGTPSNWALNTFTGERESRDQLFAAKWVTGFDLGFRFSPRIKAFLSGNNVFNVYPDEHTHSANVNNGLFRYSRHVQQFGVGGSIWSFRLLFSLPS
ncbi:MAG: TonB-dependent receptor [Lewinella sp.]